ncbi:tyrosine-type recombinase/integrase [Ferrimonas marina]|uniref:Site-specific recombinase XerD n=1 Tax=Ferrimonas marina TaxID=299255 RepID=A0A1M5NEJ1_9GAMM|nr:site-specific integrase [Ferrimonas marina]SHG87877.1 Site-specific recombinase XerD [Ferrimonas marina]
MESLEQPPYLPYFESLEHFQQGCALVNQHVAGLSALGVQDAGYLYELCIAYLDELKTSPNNFKSARSEITTFLIWCWDIEGLPLSEVTRNDMNRFLDWCASPPEALISNSQRAHFVWHKGLSMRVPNPLWRPFVNRLPKGVSATAALPYSRKASATKNQLAVLSSFYQFLNDEEYCDRNPAALAMRRSRFRENRSPLQWHEGEQEIKALNPLQLATLFKAADQLAEADPARHERTRFLITLLFSTYARISEVAARPGYSPVMAQIRRDKNGETWGFYIPMSKNGKARTVAVSDALLEALKRYRTHLELSELPAPNETLPLLVRQRTAQHGRDAQTLNANLGENAIRDEVERVYQHAAQLLIDAGRTHDAAELRTMTVHSLRHTGISADLEKGRSLHHVMADAGHQDIGITSRYITASFVEKYESARHKGLEN